ncbi:MAG: SemiSWEET family transporter [Minisyncoccia bacterium]
METLRNKFKKNEKMIGSIASALAIIMFISLIEIMISNFKGDSNIIIQPAATAINGLFWSMYAFGKKDNFLLIPNVLALVLGLFTAISAII